MGAYRTAAVEMEDFFKLTILFKNCRQLFGEINLINIGAI